jgi:adenine-specific DNA methylase
MRRFRLSIHPTKMESQATLEGKKRHSLPQTQYLGSKERFVKWILKFIPKEAKSCIDAFSGSSVIGYHLKDKGLKVISNDFLKFNHYISKALIENNKARLSEDDIKMLLSENFEKDNFIEREFAGLFYTKEECKFLDNLWFNIQKLDDDYKKAIVYTAICRTLTRKVLFGYFCHTKAMEYRTHPERVKRNPSINQDIEELFLFFLKKYNNSVFDNQQQNLAINGDILKIIQNLKVDVAYFDPPYVGIHPDYQGFYHFLETYVDYMKDKKLFNHTKMTEKKPSGFIKKEDIIKSFQELFEKSKHIPYWLISYNSRAFPDAKTMMNLIKEYKDVTLEHYEFENNFGGMGAKKGSKEYLFVCKPKI